MIRGRLPPPTLHGALVFNLDLLGLDGACGWVSRRLYEHVVNLSDRGLDVSVLIQRLACNEDSEISAAGCSQIVDFCE